MMLLFITHVNGKKASKSRQHKGQASSQKRKLLVNEVLKEDQDITAKALEALWKLHHFDEYKSRNGFCQLFTVANNSNCIVSIQLTKTAELTLLLPVHEYVRILLWGVVLTCVINSNFIKICDLEYEKVTSPQINHFEICNKIAKKLKARRIPFCLLNILRDMLPFI